MASSQTITLSWGAKKKERKEQRRLLSHESPQVGNLVVVENHGNQWPHKAQIVNIDMENKLASIRWEMTQKIDYVDLEDLKRFSIGNSVPRKQKSTDFILPLQEKNLLRLSNINMRDLIYNVAQKYVLFREELF